VQTLRRDAARSPVGIWDKVRRLDCGNIAALCGKGLYERPFVSSSSIFIRSEITTDKDFKALAVRELDIEPAAVTFETAEGVELTPVSLIVDGAERPPVDLKTISGAGFDAHIGRWRLLDPAQSRHIFLENRSPAGIAKRPYALRNNDGAGSWALIQEFPDNRFKRIQFAGTWFSDDSICQGIFQTLQDGFTGYTKLARNLPVRKLLLVTHPVDGFDCFGTPTPLFRKGTSPKA
jgi:hypothetical protein